MTSVAVVAHRLADTAPSGVGRYYREVITALAAAAGPTRLVTVTPREPDRPRWLPPEVELRTIPGPRRAVQFAWAAVKQPRIDHWTGGVDLVHALHTWAPVPTRRPLVVTVHDLMPITNPDWYRRDHRWAIGQALRYAADQAAHIVADSAWVAAQIESEYQVNADRITVVPLGVAERFRVPPSQDQLRVVQERWGLPAAGAAGAAGYVLAVGQDVARKNLVTVVRALAALGPSPRALAALGTPPRTARLPLVIAGAPGPGSEALRDEAIRLGLGDQVKVLGYVPDDLLVPLLAGATMLVHPSTDEGFGLTPIEAMAAGTPVVASRVAALPEVVGAAGILVDAHDVDAWAEAMGRLIDDDDERRRLITAGHERQAGFTWAATARRTLAIYATVIDRAGAA